MDFDFKQYFEMTTSKDYIELYQYYTKETFLDVLGVARQENPHSSFLSWLFNINASHELNENATRLFVSSLCMETLEKSNSKINVFNDSNKAEQELLKLGKYQISDFAVGNEINLGKKRLDLLISFVAKFENSTKKRIVIILENKVSSKEHTEQTQEYFDLSVDEKQRLRMLNSLYSRTDNVDEEVLVFYVFLSALNDKAICNEFLNINYQFILDNVLEPCLYLCSKDKEKSRISDYIRCLGQCRLSEENNDKNYIIMAISSKEINLVKSLLEKYKSIIELVITSIIDANSESIVSKNDIPFWKSVANVYSSIYCNTDNQLVNKINNSKGAVLRHSYLYNNQIYQSYTKYNIGRLHRDIIAYVFSKCDDENKLNDFRQEVSRQLSSKWLKECVLSKTQIDSLPDISNAKTSKSTISKQDFEEHFFIEDDLIISHNSDEYYVARYWDSNTLEKLKKIIKQTAGINDITVEEIN